MGNMVKSTAAGDEKILSYEDVVLRRSDLDILSGPEFLNDRIIEFYFSYLTSSDPHKSKLFLSPAISFWVANCQDAQSVRDVLKPLNLPSYSIVVFPVNDNEDVSRAEGGSHWSLLAYHKQNRLFIHHDSAKPTNQSPAFRLFLRVSSLLDDSDYPTLTEADTPNQVNGYDCGVYVIAIAKVISEWNEQSEPGILVPWESELKKRVTPESVAALRTEILELIKSMMEKNK